MVTGSVAPVSELLAGPALTELTPGVGTIVVTIRRLITLRTWTGAELAVAPVREGSAPLLSWYVSKAKRTAKRATEPHRTVAGLGLRLARALSVIAATVGLVLDLAAAACRAAPTAGRGRDR